MQETQSLPANWPQCLPDHPRLLLTPARLAHVRALLNDAESREVIDLLTAEGERALALPPVERIMEGRRLLTQSREIERRLVLWAFLAVVLDDARFCEAAVREMRHAVTFSDWNPSHFLDVAEISAGIGLAYDWLYTRMSAEDRALIRTGLVKLALQPGLQTDVVSRPNNWNPVCNAGLTLGALAIAEDEPEISRQTLERALQHIDRVAPCYAPDGVYAEGPMYWGYGTTFYVLLCDALQTALGSTYELELIPGLLESVQFIEHTTGPSGAFFNFADCSSLRHPMPAYMWLAQRAQLPRLAGAEWHRLLADVRQRQASVLKEKYSPTDRLFPLILVWGTPPTAPVDPELPLAWSGHGPNPVAAARTAWSTDAAYLAIKGGRAAENHGHMDAGSFIYEWAGVRWALDLGHEDYHRVESQGIVLWDTHQDGQRWTVTRLSSAAHNILLFDDAPQNVDGRATLLEAQTDAPFHAVIDLTPIYPNAVTQARRTARLFPDGRAVLEDRWTLTHSVQSIAWQMLTAAIVRVEGQRCVLESAGKRLVLQAPPSARIEILPVDELLADFEAPAPGLTRIRVLLDGKLGEEQTLRIELIPEAIANQ